MASSRGGAVDLAQEGNGIYELACRRRLFFDFGFAAGIARVERRDPVRSSPANADETICKLLEEEGDVSDGGNVRAGSGARLCGCGLRRSAWQTGEFGGHSRGENRKARPPR